jgi:hypothetical protein
MGLQDLLIGKIAVDLVIAIQKENRLLAVAPLRPMPESRYEQVETYTDDIAARGNRNHVPLSPHCLVLRHYNGRNEFILEFGQISRASSS